jgi:hypothetical protein
LIIDFKMEGKMTQRKTEESELEALRAEVAELRAELRTAIGELALATYSDIGALSETSSFHGSAHVQTKLRMVSPKVVEIVLEYLASAEAPQSSIQRMAEQMQQASQDAEQGRAQGAVIDRHAEHRAAKEEHYRAQQRARAGGA